MSSDSLPVGDEPQTRQIRINIPQRFILLPGAAIIVGTTIGLFRGSRRASLRFLAENAHRPPTTIQGWYFYNKTKNYRMLMAGLKEGGLDALKLGTSAAGWVCFEEGVRRLGEDYEPFKDVVAGLGTAGIFSLACASILHRDSREACCSESGVLTFRPYRSFAAEGGRTGDVPGLPHRMLADNAPMVTSQT